MRANNSQQKLNPICAVAAAGARYTHLCVYRYSAGMFGRLPPPRGKRKLAHNREQNKFHSTPSRLQIQLHPKHTRTKYITFNDNDQNGAHGGNTKQFAYEPHNSFDALFSAADTPILYVLRMQRPN